MPEKPSTFLVLVYRMPAKPTAGRVAVWRQLKKIGAIYIQQSVSVFPDNREVRADLQPILARIVESGGEYHLLPVRKLSDIEQQKLAGQFLEQTAKHYAEIIENCEVNFQKEIEFEIFRQNFTYEEAEEIRVEFEKISSWFERVKSRDWFGAPNQADAARWIAKCEELVDDFDARVFAVQEVEGSTTGTPDTPKIASSPKGSREAMVSDGRGRGGVSPSYRRSIRTSQESREVQT